MRYVGELCSEPVSCDYAGLHKTSHHVSTQCRGGKPRSRILGGENMCAVGEYLTREYSSNEIKCRKRGR